MLEALAKIINSKSKTFLAFCFCFIVGTGSFSFLENNKFLFYFYILLFVVLFFIIIFWHKKLERFLILCSLFFVLGGLRFLISIPSHSLSRIEFYNGQKVTLQGWISQEPDIGLSDARYVVSVEGFGDHTITPPFIPPLLPPPQRGPASRRWGEGQREGYVAGNNTIKKSISGNIIIKTRLYPQYNYGDEFKINCFLQEPGNFANSNFNYQKYLAKQGVWSVCVNPTIVSLGGNKGNFFIKAMLRLKSKISHQMSKLWPEPESSLVAGILYGRKNGLPKELLDNFSRTGISHIIAVSGYNVSIIAVVLNICLIYIGLSRRQSFWFLISLILAFVFFTGATASVVRAGVMAGIVLFAQHAGRLSSAGRALLYAAVIMLLFNPYVLIWDVGFQLSFLSTLGLVYLSPILESVVFKKISRVSKDGTRPWLMSLIGILVTTFSAIIATLPLILFQFGRLSLVAPLVNVFILWLVPWLMLFGFVSLIFSFLFFPFGQVIAWVAGLGLKYVIIIVNWFGSKSWSAVTMQIPIWMMFAMYTLIIYFVVAHTPPFTPPPTAVRRGPAVAVVKGEGRGEGLWS